MNNQQPPVAKREEQEEESSSSSVITKKNKSLEPSSKVQEKADISTEGDGDGDEKMVTEKEVSSVEDDPMDEDSVNPANVFCISLKQPRSNLLHKMSVPELCRNFRSDAELEKREKAEKTKGLEHGSDSVNVGSLERE
ncbi:hypothetical protein FXO38_30513 [Capsicum annuum]|nr:hypothetical protein FXO38_30513 [Capsicum annuum]